MTGNFCPFEIWIFLNIFGIFPAQQFFNMVLYLGLDLDLGLGLDLDLGLGLESKSVTSW